MSRHDVPSRSPRPRAVLALLTAWSCGLGLLAAEPPPTVPRPAIVDRFFARQESPVESLRVRRRLEARNERFNKHGWLEAVTTLDRAHGFRYEITAEGGSGYIRGKVLRKALEREREAWESGEGARSSLSDANYVFTDPAEIDGLLRVAIEPRRKDNLLVRGSVFFTPADADLVRIEGALAKTPSFWTRHVHVVRRYGRIEGHRLPLSLESTAQIRMAGTSTFAMTYEYEEIDGKKIQKG